MIAQIVLDLPIDGPFDYLIPEPLASQVVVGSRVKVPFGPKRHVGFVVGLLAASALPRLKSIHSSEASPAFNSLDLNFAGNFAAYYGCSLGEALGAMLRNKVGQQPAIRREHKPTVLLYRCQPCRYAARIKEIMQGYQEEGQATFFILVPDAFKAEMLLPELKGLGPLAIGTRSSVFECNGRHQCVIMVDEEDASYKQEQTPMYETRQVLLERSRMYGFDIAFVGVSPSVELMALVDEKKVRLLEDRQDDMQPARLVDLSNYKFIPGMLSPPVRDALDAALKAGKKSVLVLNRRGSYRMTRCVDCGEALKCSSCDSPLIYSRSKGLYLCRHCTYTVPGDTVCPKCRKPSWRSQGIGVEQLQTELKKQFPQAKILAFERDTGPGRPLGDFDILISTQAVLRFQGRWKAQTAAFIDFDAELNRLDIRSAFNAFSLVLHISTMAVGPVLIQTRNSSHYVLQHLSRGNAGSFYREELDLRKELGFSPFKHWIKLTWRGKSEKAAYEIAQDVYNVLKKGAGEAYTVTPPLADAVSRKRGQFRFNVMVQADEVPAGIALIKSGLAQIKRRSGVIATINVDPS